MGDVEIGDVELARPDFSISSMIEMRMLTSSIEVGSSATTKAGSITRARAMATRCRCPPDNSWGKRNMKVAAGMSPTNSSSSATRSSRSGIVPMPWT